jgi:peptidoglycan hydrolase-like protein with peptidoglycan-binding domain
MKITGKQLRQIIKEELARNLMNEEDPIDKVSQDVGDETTARAAAMLKTITDSESAAAQAKMDRAAPDLDIDAILATLPDAKSSAPTPFSPSSGIIDAIRERGTPEQLNITNQNYAAAQKTLDAVLEGSKIIQLGDKGAATKIVQLLVLTQLSSFIGIANRAAEYATMKGFAGEVLKQLEAAKSRLKADGDFGPATKDAIRAAQGAMYFNSVIAKKVGAPERPIPASRLGTMDGKVGRQTLNYLINRRLGAAVTDASEMSENTARRWNRLAGLIKS